MYPTDHTSFYDYPDYDFYQNGHSARPRREMNYYHQPPSPTYGTAWTASSPPTSSVRGRPYPPEYSPTYNQHASPSATPSSAYPAGRAWAPPQYSAPSYLPYGSNEVRQKNTNMWSDFTQVGFTERSLLWHCKQRHKVSQNDINIGVDVPQPTNLWGGLVHVS